jgi:D-beta-D-heptose 7-phosphate kinase/D-beta-D-heptose 1-phosphate adenosyltransferase
MSYKEKLFKIIDNFKNFKILVIGDIILDEYIWGKAGRLSPEAPVPVLEVNKYTYILGGAANVANNIRTLGGKVCLAGIVGKDSPAEKLNEILSGHDIDKSCIIVDENRPTTIKTRLITHNHHQLVRFDREIKDEIPENLKQEIINKVSESIETIDLILLSDYAKGVLTPGLTHELIKLAKLHNKPVLVDPKGLDYSKYSGATLITPNRLEAETATKSPAGTAPEILAKKVREQLELDYVMITLGEDGILLCNHGEIKQIPAVTSEVYDVTGAGDSLISGISLALLASDGDVEISMELGNYAAGVAVRKIGTTAVTPKELKHIIEHDLLEKQEAAV